MSKFLTVIHDTTDISKYVKDYGTASVTTELLSSEYLYVGYYKPFAINLYLELSSLNTNGGILNAEYFDGTTWQPLNTLLDETENASKSGFLLADKPDKWAATTIETKENFYIRFSTDTDWLATTAIQGLAILLSNDLDLEGVRSNIVSKHNSGSSWILKHEQARKDIIQLLRNKGNRIVKNRDNNDPLVSEGVRFLDLTEFDLLQPDQLRQASMYKVLSMIYLDELSDNNDDKWFTQGERYEDQFEKMFNLFYLNIDFDDDGISDDGETTISTNTSLTWL
jgi:hypothetical protein